MSVGDFSMRAIRRIGLVGLALLATGCAGGGGGGFYDLPRDGPERAQLFVSPSGQPFRAPPGEPYPSAAWFAAADADKDGRLTRAEFRADAEAWFKTLDANGDGALDMPEATRWEEDLVPEIARMAAIGGAGLVGRNELSRTQGAAAFSLINEPHPVRGADADFDFRVTAREWVAATERRFGVLDKDGDGVVLALDLKRTPVQARAARSSTFRREAVGARRPF